MVKRQHTDNPQSYKLTAEFMLRNKSDYKFYKRSFDHMFQQLNESAFFQLDYLTIEKTQETEHDTSGKT